MFAKVIVRARLACTLLTITMVTVSMMVIIQPSALAVTNQFRGVNWADTRDNYNTGWVIPDGLDASDNYGQVYTKANNYVNAFRVNLGANTVRLPINPPSVSQSWWSAYRGAVDAALNNHMSVILSTWTENKNVGTITDSAAWYAMWSTVVSDYGANPNVYFELLNEPHGYSLSQWVSICKSWLAKFSSVPRSRVIISGTGYNDRVTDLGAEPALNGTLLSLHYYGFWKNYTSELNWQSDLKDRIGSYASRTIIDEFGAPMSTGIDYLANHNSGQYESYFAAVTNLARSASMGSVYWPGLRTGDSYSMESLSGSGLSNNNASGVTQLRWGWGY